VAHVGAGATSGTAAPSAHKILVAGGFGAGKTTLVASVSEVGSLVTDVPFSGAGARKDNLDGLPDKTTTTVALDFGRITVGDGLMLYLFGVPGQDRFWFMWDELARGALGAVVLADVRRLADCFPSLNYFEKHRLPFLVAVNHFDDAPHYPLDAIRQALDLSEDVPVVTCDARDHDSVKETLICLVESMAGSLAGRS
jgi:signal recognition particle receptor subunit beta